MEEQTMVNEAKPINPSLENQLEKSGQMAIVHGHREQTGLRAGRKVPG